MFAGEVGDGLCDFGGAGGVGVGDAGEVWGEVGEDEVGGLAEGVGDGGLGCGEEEVALDDDCAGDGLDGEEVGGDDFAVGPGELGGDLRPSAGGGAKVGDDCAGVKEGVGLVDLEEFEGGAGAVSGGAGGADVGVALLSLSPLGGLGFGAARHGVIAFRFRRKGRRGRIGFRLGVGGLREGLRREGRVRGVRLGLCAGLGGGGGVC